MPYRVIASAPSTVTEAAAEGACCAVELSGVELSGEELPGVEPCGAGLVVADGSGAAGSGP
jgi:hypothetical protein